MPLLKTSASLVPTISVTHQKLGRPWERFVACSRGVRNRMSAPRPFRSPCNRYCSIFLLLRQGSHTERGHIYCRGASIGLLRRMLLCVVQRLVLRRCECSEATIVVSCAIVVVAN